MTTTTTFQGMEPGAKNSSRVLRPPGGASNISFGTDDDKTPVRKNKMASNIFAEPDDPHAHRRNNPPGGQPTGILCGEPSAPLRRCPQPLLFPKNDGLEQTSICNSAAKVEVHEQANDECPEDGEADQEQREEPSLPSAPSGASPAASSAAGRRNPPGGKSSLILG
ncbi:jupiter microtubule associated homolog 1b [Hypomesus transpacificus]|uniref:jupiter microtubule associated homolog 1b n=1 Tax=Hypomesus transpacificus TaxID=137520 RepID=UPI001F083FA7|nr:jupiter microtubule associated homolog 1b [Hypomesus transpacificus]